MRQQSTSCLITSVTLNDFISRATEVFKANVFNTVDLGLILLVTKLMVLTLSFIVIFFHIFSPFWLQPVLLVMHEVVNIPAIS